LNSEQTPSKGKEGCLKCIAGLTDESQTGQASFRLCTVKVFDVASHCRYGKESCYGGNGEWWNESIPHAALIPDP